MTCMKCSKGFRLLTALALVLVVSGLPFLRPEITRAQEGQGDPAPKKESQRRLILLYGYWPPTDIGTDQRHGILYAWSTRKQYKTTNYDVLAITPQFPTERLGRYPSSDPADDFWGKGTNRAGTADPLIMDYRETGGDFWSEVAKYKPIAIMAFGRGELDKSWVLEPWGKNLKTTDPNQWYYSITYAPNQGNPVTVTWDAPYGGGSANDPSPYGAGKPGAVPPKTGTPPDPTQDAGAKRNTSLPTGGIVTAIEAVNGIDVDPTNEHPDGPGTFVCNFMAYLVAWWKEYSANLPDNEKCKAAGFTHVGGQVTPGDGEKAVDAQIGALVEWLNAN